MNKQKKLTLLFLFCLDTSFFYLIKIPGFISQYINNYQKAFLVVVVFIVMLFYIKQIVNYRYYFIYNILGLIFIFTMAFIIGTLRYDQNIKSILIVSIHFLVPLVYLFFMIIIKDKKSLDNFQNILIYCGTFLALLFNFQYIIFNLTNKVFLNININKSIIATRFGGIRIYESSFFILFSSILAISFFLKEKNRKKRFRYLLFLTIMIYYIFIVFKSRIAIISIISIFTILMLIKRRKNIVKKFIAILLVLATIILLINSEYGKLYLESIKSKDGGVRSEATKYYNRQTSEMLLTGIGFVNSSQNDELRLISMGPDNIFYKDDVGIINIFNTFGVFGLTWYISLVVMMINVTINVIKKMSINDSFVLIGCLLLIIITSFTMIITDSQRIFVLPCILTIFDSYFKLSKQKSIR